MVGIQLDRLTPAERRLVRSASILGTAFEDDVLRELLENDDADLSPLEGFVTEDGPGRHRFRHALVRDAAYEGLPYRRRRELHARAAAVLEQRAGPDHVSAGEGVLVVDRAVDMGLGGEVDDRVTALHRLTHGGGILDGALDQLGTVRQVLAPPGIGELVEDDDVVLVTYQPHVGGADEACGAGNQESHSVPSCACRWAR